MVADNTARLSNRLAIALGTVTLAFVVVLIAGTSTAVAAPTTITNCTTIDAPGEYVLGADIDGSANATCIAITSSDVVLDGAGHSISGSDADNSIGVHVNGSSGARLNNVTVSNLALANWEAGLYYDTSDDGTILNVTATSNRDYGLYFQSVTNVTVGEVTTADHSGSYDSGIKIAGSSGITVSVFDSTNDGYGVSISGGSGHTIRDSTIAGNKGVSVGNTQLVTVRDNSFTDTSPTIDVSDSGDVLVDNNTVVDGSLGVLTGSNGPPNRITNNRIYESSKFATGADCGGMSISNGAADDLIANNSWTQCNWGVSIQNSNRIDFRNNTISGTDGGNSDYGLRVANGAGHQIVDNVIEKNGVYPKRAGILLGTNQAYLSGNTLAGNGFNLRIGDGGNWSSISHTIDATNTVEGRPVAYHVNETDVIVDPHAGWVGLIGTQNATLADMNFTANNWENVLLRYADDTVIRNVDTTPSWVGVHMRDGSDRTRIEDSHFDSGRGITMDEASGTQIFNTSITNSGGYGVYLSKSPDTTFENVTITGSSRRGIGVQDSVSQRVTVANSTVSTNDWGGIDLYRSAWSSVRDSNVQNNGGAGIIAQRYFNNATITGNLISGNDGDGITVSYYAADNLITYNTITGNAQNGIELGNQGSNVTITGNVLTGNAVGLDLPSVYEAPVVYDNHFNNTDNVVFADSTGVANATWNTTATPGPNVLGGATIGGNYWANQSGTGFSETCSDTDVDGFCDTPYSFDGQTDFLPLAMAGGASAEPGATPPWPHVQHDSAQSGFLPGATGLTSGAVAWNVTLAGSEIDRQVQRSPIVVGQTVIVADTGGNLTALNTTTGAMVWTFETNGPLDTAPVSDGQRVYFLGQLDNGLGGSEDVVAALDADTGTLSWRFNTTDHSYSINRFESVTAVGGTVYVHLEAATGAPEPGSHIAALDAGTGAPNWDRVDHLTDVDAGLWSRMLTADGSIYYLTRNNSLPSKVYVHAVNATDGTNEWRVKHETTFDTPTPTAVAIANDRLYYVSTDGTDYRLFAFDLTTQSMVLDEPVPGDLRAEFIAATDRAVYLAYDNARFAAYNATTGTVLWDQRLEVPGYYLHPSTDTGPVVIGDTVYLHASSSGGSYVFAFNALSGSERWNLSIDGPSSPFAYADGSLYAAGQQVWALTNASATGPDVLVSPTSLDFGNVSVGNTSTANVTMTNVGGTTLNVTGVSLSGTDASAFSVVGGGPTTLLSGDSTNLTVRFAPTTNGSKTATLSIASNDSDEPSIDILLTGSGVAASGGTTSPVSVNAITVLNGTVPNATPFVETWLDAQPMLQLNLRSSEFGDYDLEGLGVDHTTEFEIDLTVQHFTPRLLLGAGNLSSWTTAPNGTNATDVTIRVRPVATQSLMVCDAGGNCTTPDLADWPTGANDTATNRTNVSVSLAVDDLSVYPSAQRTLLDGSYLTTDAQLFGSPVYQPATGGQPATLSLLVGGPHFTVDGANNAGFYTAFLPDALLAAWNVTSPDQLSAAYQGDTTTFSAWAVTGGMVLDVELHYSAGEVSVSTVDTIPPVAAAGADRTIDEGDSVQFDGSTSTDNVGVTAYQWDFGDGTSATGPTASKNYATAGTYTVTLTVLDAAGNTDTDTAVVTVLTVQQPTSGGGGGGQSPPTATPVPTPTPMPTLVATDTPASSPTATPIPTGTTTPVPATVATLTPSSPPANTVETPVRTAVTSAGSPPTEASTVTRTPGQPGFGLGVAVLALLASALLAGRRR